MFKDMADGNSLIKYYKLSTSRFRVVHGMFSI